VLRISTLSLYFVEQDWRGHGLFECVEAETVQATDTSRS
jgi:hypothetical protein